MPNTLVWFVLKDLVSFNDLIFVNPEESRVQQGKGHPIPSYIFVIPPLRETTFIF